jgi:hypothetical protein
MPDERTYGFSAEDATSILQSIGTAQSPQPETKWRQRSAELVVILDADLPAASHALTGPTSCLATVCDWNSTTSQYVESVKQITVWNHAESTSHAEDTFGYARVVDGHYHFFGDCNAMGAR